MSIHHRSFKQSLLDGSLALAKQGIPNFASGRFRQPLAAHGYKDATCDPDRLRQMFLRSGAMFISIATGRPSGLIAIDIDPRHNGHLWLRANEHRLRRTLTHGTPSGGIHLIFVNPNDVDLRCSQGRVAPGVDVKANGGSVIVPPGPGYSVRDNVPPAPMPPWLIKVCLPPEPVSLPAPPRRSPLAGDGSRYGLAALDAECRAIATAPFGKQEATLNSSAFKIGGLCAAGELDAGFAVNELIAAGLSMPNQQSREPWLRGDVEKKIRRSFRDGMRQPRHVVHRFTDRRG